MTGAVRQRKRLTDELRAESAEMQAVGASTQVVADYFGCPVEDVEDLISICHSELLDRWLPADRYEDDDAKFCATYDMAGDTALRMTADARSRLALSYAVRLRRRAGLDFTDPLDSPHISEARRHVGG